MKPRCLSITGDLLQWFGKEKLHTRRGFWQSLEIKIKEINNTFWQIISGKYGHDFVGILTTTKCTLMIHFRYMCSYLDCKPQPLSQRSNYCRSRKCIRCHIPMHEFFAVFIYILIPVLSRSSSILGLQRPEDRATLLFSSRSSPITGDVHGLRGKRFCACYPQALEKVPRAESGTFWFPWMDSHDSSTSL